MRHISSRLVTTATCTCILALILACADENEGSAGYESLFVANTSGVTPVFKPAPAAVALAKASMPVQWPQYPLYSVFYTLREFVSSRDEGRIDRANLYKLLIDVDNVFTGSAPDAQPITPQLVTAPCAGMDAIMCDRAHNDVAGQRAIALNDNDSAVSAIISWIWGNTSTQREYGVATIRFNRRTQDVVVDMVFSVDYNPANTATDYNLRCQVSGNAAANAFEFKYIVGDTRIVAKGVSRGAGNNMLFKYTMGSAPVQYMVVPGTADELFFIGQSDSATAVTSDTAAIPTSVAAYKDWVVSSSLLTSADLLTDISTLNTGNPKQGTIYLNVQ